MVTHELWDRGQVQRRRVSLLMVLWSPPPSFCGEDVAALVKYLPTKTSHALAKEKVVFSLWLRLITSIVLMRFYIIAKYYCYYSF